MRRKPRDYWTRRILGILSESVLPVTTRDLVALTGALDVVNGRRLVWCVLRRLREMQLVRSQLVRCDMDVDAYRRGKTRIPATVHRRSVCAWVLVRQPLQHKGA